MILQIRTETYYAIEMTEKQVQELSLVFDGLQDKDISAAIGRMEGVTIKDLRSIRETVQTFRLAIAERQRT